MIFVQKSEIDIIKWLHKEMPEVKKFMFDSDGRLIGVEYFVTQKNFYEKGGRWPNEHMVY